MNDLTTLRNRLNPTVLLHLGCWLAYIGYELFFLRYFSGLTEPFLVYACYYLTNIGWFYSILWLLGRPRKSTAAGLALLLLRGATLLLAYLAVKLMTAYFLQGGAFVTMQFRYPLNFMLTNTYRGSVFAFLALFYYLAGHLAAYRRKTLEAEKSQLLLQRQQAALEHRLVISQNAYLQQQLNPHLLFNALNFVYSEIFKHSADGARALELLTELLRFCLEESDVDGRISLSAEIAQIGNLIEINRFRFGRPPALQLILSGDFEQRRIIPLILLTLTENMFKHGNLRDASQPAELAIRLNERGQLYFRSRNLKKAVSGRPGRSAIGLKNIRLRLDQTYADQYQLVISETENFFELNLNLDL